jgi:hypothetical protein
MMLLRSPLRGSGNEIDLALRAFARSYVRSPLRGFELIMGLESAGFRPQLWAVAASRL